MSTSSEDVGAESCWPIEATRRMNQMYRRQRHIYNGTRRYYLLGRDRLISDLDTVAGSTVLEIGCGTGRNLVRAATLYPDARFFGIDVSTEMLTSAISAISRHGLSRRILVAHGDATMFDPQVLLGTASFDRVIISYSLSMIPDWRRVLQVAINLLTPGGRLHVVDFGNQERLPDFARALLLRWLAIFEVTPRPELEGALSVMAKASHSAISFERPFGGYVQYAVLTSPKPNNA